MLTGIAAFLLGSVSTDLYAGGDPKITGLDGLAGISGFAFFQLNCFRDTMGVVLCSDFGKFPHYAWTHHQYNHHLGIDFLIASSTSCKFSEFPNRC